MTDRTRCGLGKLRESGKLLCGNRFPIKLKWAVYKSYVRPAIQFGNEAWCRKDSEIGILQRSEKSSVRAMCGVQLKDRKRAMDMLMLGLTETTDQLAMANTVHWHGHELRREDGRVLRRTLVSDGAAQKKNGRPRKTWKKQVREKA